VQLGRKVYFITVAETRNITKAAQILHVSQPSLSQYLTHLEQSLGVKLLDRNFTPLRLTEAGEIYLEYVKDCVEVERRFEKKLEQYKMRQEQTLVLGIPTQLTLVVFESIVQDFLLKYPNVKLIGKEGPSTTLKEQLLCGEVDIAFFHTKEKNEPSFERHIMYEENLFLACGRDSQFAKGRTATRENPLIITKDDFPELEQMRFITLAKNYYLNEVMLEYIHETGITPKRIVEIPHLRTIVNCIMDPGSDGISMLADFVLQNLDYSEYLTFMKVEGHDVSWYLSMNCLADKPKSQAAKRFWNDALEVINE